MLTVKIHVMQKIFLNISEFETNNGLSSYSKLNCMSYTSSAIWAVAKHVTHERRGVTPKTMLLFTQLPAVSCVLPLTSCFLLLAFLFCFKLPATCPKRDWSELNKQVLRM